VARISLTKVHTWRSRGGSVDRDSRDRVCTRVHFLFQESSRNVSLLTALESLERVLCNELHNKEIHVRQEREIFFS
jgi:hypothetical protein